jgi:hypothetical protein
MGIAIAGLTSDARDLRYKPQPFLTTRRYFVGLHYSITLKQFYENGGYEIKNDV